MNYLMKTRKEEEAEEAAAVEAVASLTAGSVTRKRLSETEPIKELYAGLKGNNRGNVDSIVNLNINSLADGDNGAIMANVNDDRYSIYGNYDEDGNYNGGNTNNENSADSDDTIEPGRKKKKRNRKDRKNKKEGEGKEKAEKEKDTINAFGHDHEYVDNNKKNKDKGGNNDDDDDDDDDGDNGEDGGDKWWESYI